MILRNPSLRRDFLFTANLLLFIFFSSFAQAQGLKGYVREQGTQQAISGATIILSKADSIIATLSSGDDGSYEFKSTLAGRFAIQVRSIGYRLLVEDILLDGYTTQRLDLFLPIQITELPEVVMVTDFQPEVHVITADDLKITAANFDDPVRVAVSDPGVVQLNDQANHLSIRGQNPIFNTWHLEGLEVVNPNHTNNAGTFSDQPVQSGGGVNMFSAQVLASTDIYTGINPLSIGRSAGAVIDMHLHETNKPELRAKAGFLGFELGGGKQIGSHGVIDINLRYSFTGLLADLGVDFGGEKIGFYDGVISYLNEGAKHRLKIFAWGGQSKNNFDHAVAEDIERYKDLFDIDYSNQILGSGIKYTFWTGNKISFTTGAAYSSLNTRYDKEGFFGVLTVPVHIDEKTDLLSSLAEINIRHSGSFSTSAGINYTYKKIEQKGLAFTPFTNESFIRPYANFQVGSAVTTFEIEIGAELNYALANASDAASIYPGYRGNIQWHANNTFTVYGGARHAAGQNVNTFGTEEAYSLPMLVDKYELGAALRINEHQISVKNYFQEIRNLTILYFPEGYIHLADYTDPFLRSMMTFGENSGVASYYGIEGEWKYRNEKGWRISANQTFYKSEHNHPEDDIIDGRFDGGYATHLTLAKEIINVRKEKNRIWNLSLRGIINGGIWEQTIDVALSRERENTEYTNPGIFDQQLPVYKRVDASISRTIANEKIRWRFALDIQNALSFTNIAFRYFDPFLNNIESQKQLGIIPVFSVQASWQ